ncbi:MAG TPA: MFS transporter [Candidatus Omnitrophota bacterium]|nr:MFS transporter [Candidatus Omnitrophota bacterium]
MKKGALATVFLVVLVDLLGFGIVLPLLPFYASEFNASGVSIGLLYSVYSLSQLIFSPIWGGLSDRFGRRPIMILSTAGSTMAYILFSFSPSMALLFASRILAGVMGGNIATAQAYVADVTTPENRARGMGLIGAAFGIGFVIGPALASLLIHPVLHPWFPLDNKFALPGLVAASLSFLSFLLVLTKLPETVHKTSPALTESQRASRPGLLSPEFWKLLARQNASSPRHILPFLLACALILSFGQSTLYSAFPIFCKTALGLAPERVGVQFALMGVIAIVIQGGLIRPLEKRFGETPLFVTGSILMASGIALIPLAKSELYLAAILTVMAIGGSLNGPTLNSLISKEADPSKTGQAMGSAQGFSALGRVIGPAWGGALIGMSLMAPFVLTGAIVVTTVLIALKFRQADESC